MQYQLKPISLEAIPEALQKAERYRLLNEPAQAESICQDVIAVDPDNQQALIMLLLAITDQFGHGASTAARAREVLRRVQGDYEKAYYSGVIAERTARSQLSQGSPNSVFTAYDSFLSAMDCYARAEASRPPGNDDSILRWNSCARTLMQNQNLRPRPDEQYQVVLGE